MLLLHLLALFWALLANTVAGRIAANHTLITDHSNSTETQPALVNATALAVQKRDDRGYYRPPQHWNNYTPWPPEYWQWGFLNCKNVLELEKRPTATCEYYFENCPGNTHISFTVSIEPNGETNGNWCAAFYDYIADECGSPRIHWTRCNTHFMSDLDGYDGISVDFDFTPDFPVEKFNDGCIQAAVRRATCDLQLEHVTMANGGCVFVGSCEDNVDPFQGVIGHSDALGSLTQQPGPHFLLPS